MTERILPPKARLVPEQAKRVFEGTIFDIYQWEQEMFDGSTQTYEMIKRPDSVVVFAVDEGKVVVVQEEQSGGIKRYDSLPKGRVDPQDATTLAAAQRELREETGMEFNDWHLLQITQPVNTIEWFVYYYVALRKSGQQEPHTDPGEKISVDLIDFDKFKNAENYFDKEIKAIKEANSLEEFLAGLPPKQS